MILFGILVVLLGILCISAPFLAGTAVAALVGALLLAAGVIRVIWAFKAETFGKGVLAFLVGGITAFAGVLTLAQPLAGLASLTMLLAAYFLVDGIFEIAASFQLEPQSGRGWVLFDGIITLVLAWMIWGQWPLSGAWAIGVLVGVRLLMAGWAMIFAGSAVRAVSKGLSARA